MDCTNVNTNSSYYFMTTCFDHIAVIHRPTVGMKNVCILLKLCKILCRLGSSLVLTNSCGTDSSHFVSFVDDMYDYVLSGNNVGEFTFVFITPISFK